MGRMGKRMLTKEDITLLFLKDPSELRLAIISGKIPKSDEIRTLICEFGDPKCAYEYANYIDQGPHPETRTVACKSSPRAYWYAKYIDQRPTYETRSAAYKDVEWGNFYKEWVNSY